MVTNLLHEAAHIKDLVDREVRYHPNGWPVGQSSLAGEIHADSHARAGVKALGYEHESDLRVSMRIMGSFCGKSYPTHETTPLVNGNPHDDADDYLKDAKRFYGEAEKAYEFVSGVERHLLDNPEYFEAAKGIYAKMKEMLGPDLNVHKEALEKRGYDVNDKELARERKYNLNSGRELICNYAVTKVLLEKGQ